MRVYFRIIPYLLLMLYSVATFGQKHKSNDYWLSIIDTVTDQHGYKNQNGDTVVPFGKYLYCFTDTFRTYAVVIKQHLGFVAIDRQEKVLYSVFPFDNGPDYPSNGLFRIVKNNKIGYADEITGTTVIKPQFDCAFPFENGVAKVGMNCTMNTDDSEHHAWTTDSWIYINKKGRKVNLHRSKE